MARACHTLMRRYTYKGIVHSMKNDKYEFLYHYSRSAFEDELQRFRNVEEKANKFIALLSIVIVGYTALIQAYAKAFFSPSTFIEYLCLTFIALTYIALVSSWSFLFRSLKFIEMPRLPLDQKFIDNFKEKELPTHHYTLSITCNDGLILARESVTKKSKLLIKAYKDISFAAWLISISLCLLTIITYINKDKNTMTDKESSQQQQTQYQSQSQPEPDFTASAPKVVMVLDHAIEKSDTKSQTLNESTKK